MLLYPEELIYYFEVWSEEKSSSDKKPIFHSLQTSTQANQLGYYNTNEHILSFNVEEEEMNATIITLAIRDETGFLFPYFRIGKRFFVRWGFIFKNDAISKLLYTQSYRDEVPTISYRGGMLRESLDDTNGIKCFVTNMPAFKLDSGVCEFSVNLRVIGKTMERIPINRTYTFSTTIKEEKDKPTNIKTYGDIIRHVATREMGILQTKQLIDFDIMDKPITTSIVRSCETATQFLRRLATHESMVGLFGPIKFAYGMDYRNRYLIFISWEKEYEKNKELLNNIKEIQANKGFYHYFDYGHAKANVLRIEGKVETGGIGSIAVPVMSADGKPSMTFLPSGQVQVTQWVYSQEKTEAALRSIGVNTPAGKAEYKRVQQATIVGDVFNENGEVRGEFQKYFDKRTDSTAKEGMGITLELECIPNPSYLIGHLAWIGPNKENIEKDSLLYQAQSLIPDFFVTSKNLKMRNYYYDEDGAVKTENVKSERFTYYRISKLSWTHDSNGVSQKVTLMR